MFLWSEINMSKTALVTGAGRGIGRSIALRLAESGYDVGINYITNKEAANEVCEQAEALGSRAICLQADIGRFDEVKGMFERFFEIYGHIDLLVNNAGITRFKPFLEVSEDLWDQVVSSDWKGAYFCSQFAAKNMIEYGIPGVIINISSNQQKGNWRNASIYGPAKAALMKFTEHIALELAEHQIRVNAIAPGYTIKEERLHTPREQKIISTIPLKRFVKAEEIAQAVIFLASKEASSITGNCLYMDGGALLPTCTDHFNIP
jgi:NAD(P)-dependent dehydrogenase (short-subunit alcohol dehydrogenase family)